jgi:hypothetical protein
MAERINFPLDVSIGQVSVIPGQEIVYLVMDRESQVERIGPMVARNDVLVTQFGGNGLSRGWHWKIGESSGQQ